LEDEKMPFEELKARQSVAWGSAPWERLSWVLTPVHEQLAMALWTGTPVRWLDVGTGTGALAIRAARLGANVTGVDFAPRLIETARRLADADGIEARFEVGDAEALPFDAASFDVVSSAMGLILAPDHDAVARELGRVCRVGGRIGFSAWRPGATFTPVTSRYSPPLAPGQGDSIEWGDEQYVRDRLSDWFELRFEEGDAPLTGGSGEEAWQLMLEAAGPFRARAESLPPDELARFHAEFVDYLEQHRGADGVHVPGPYLVVLGTRR
jgi:SAM-dependent methyltransferase